MFEFLTPDLIAVLLPVLASIGAAAKSVKSHFDKKELAAEELKALKDKERATRREEERAEFIQALDQAASGLASADDLAVLREENTLQHEEGRQERAAAEVRALEAISRVDSKVDKLGVDVQNVKERAARIEGVLELAPMNP